MKPKQQKNPGHLPVGEKGPTVAPGSQQTRPPGVGSNEQSGSQQIQREFRAMQESHVGERGGPGSQQGGWSARQQAQRMQQRGEEQRRGESQQSGYGGLEQNQMSGAEEQSLAPQQDSGAKP